MSALKNDSPPRMITAKDILYEDNHLIVINKRSGQLVQPDPDGTPGLEDFIKDYIKVRDAKPGAVFLGVVHRIDRPVSGVVVFAKTSKALVRLNEQLRDRGFQKMYWAVVEQKPALAEGELRHFLVRNPKTNKTIAHDTLPKIGDPKEAILKYKTLKSSDNYHLLEVELLTGRHHQIRCQLSKVGCHIKGDLKYGAARSNRDGSISLHARELIFTHPVSGERLDVVCPVPEGDALWAFFCEGLSHAAGGFRVPRA